MVRLTFDAGDDVDQRNPSGINSCRLDSLIPSAGLHGALFKVSGLQFLLARSKRCVHFDRDVQPTQMAIESGAHDTPLQLALAGTKRGHRERGDTPFSVMLFQIDQSLDDVGKPRDCPPVPFSREVQNPRRDDTRKEIGLPESHLAGLAAPDVVLVHIGKTLLEL